MIASFYVNAEGAVIPLRKSKQRLPVVNESFCREESDMILMELKDRAPKRTGLFAKGLRRFRIPGLAARGKVRIDIMATGAHAFLAPYIERGTRPHVIRSKKPMPMYYGTEPVTKFAYYVRHPGMKGSRYISNAVRDSNKQARQRGGFAIRRLPMFGYVRK